LHVANCVAGVGDYGYRAWILAGRLDV
jgi:hypothetical protein